jgi:hypothetical protein
MKSLITALFAALCTLATLPAEVREAPNLNPIAEEILSCDSNSLVLLDVGGTLVIPKDPILHVSHEEWKAKWFQEHYPDLTHEENVLLIRAVEQDNSHLRLTDNWPELIKKAQASNIKMVAFTKCPINHIRLDWLTSFGLYFLDELKELPYQNDSFTYTSGVIQTDQKIKGPVLKEIVSKLNQRPSKIVFVDDRINQVKSVEEACKELNIPFVGFHYIAYEASPYLDEEIAHIQLETLVKEHKWISQEDIQCQINEY